MPRGKPPRLQAYPQLYPIFPSLLHSSIRPSRTRSPGPTHVNLIRPAFKSTLFVLTSLCRGVRPRGWLQCKRRAFDVRPAYLASRQQATRPSSTTCLTHANKRHRNRFPSLNQIVSGSGELCVSWWSRASGIGAWKRQMFGRRIVSC